MRAESKDDDVLVGNRKLGSREREWWINTVATMYFNPTRLISDAHPLALRAAALYGTQYMHIIIYSPAECG